ncbi:hypothetical protein GGQ87_002391 [Brevundimonas alba]|uniref:Uncharacterized protein n=1 Tax=Brevundimonas alba TaxID=74314 RepID=A0A7X6BQ16_9CAUL|nr:hypothetical protein [Brevundimonas alba]NJC42096.1 hypothetical protein [Brevundimonas alba]
MTPDRKLEAFFAADRPSSRDYAFQIEVARRIAKRRAWMTGLALIPWALIGAVLLWALDTAAGPYVGGLADTALPVAMALTLAVAGAGAALWLTRRFSAG